MSVKVELDELSDIVGQLDATVFLLTTNDDASPHPAHVRVTYDGVVFALSAGRRSCLNSSQRSVVTLLWPAHDPDSMHLLIDGVAEVVSAADGVILLTPTSAMWHRQPDQPAH